MAEAGVYIRTATAQDAKQIRDVIKHTLASPDGRGPRRRFEEAAGRQELLVVERYDTRERVNKVVGFVEWHTRIDGTSTIRDAGTAGEEPQPTIMRRLIREMIALISPPTVQVKVRDDLTAWNQIFADLPGFHLEGREYSRPHWRNIWVWSGEVPEPKTRTPITKGRRHP